jgi:hypothetical protein
VGRYGRIKLMVEKVYIQGKIRALIISYREKVNEIINPDNFQDWSDIGFDEKPEDFDTIEDFLEQDCTLDEREQTSIALYREILEDLKTLVEKDDPEIEAEMEKRKKRK